MRCPYCFGTGKRMRASEIGPDYVIGSWGPCGECQGSGVIHCCEGDRACPEDDQPADGAVVAIGFRRIEAPHA